MAWDTFAKIDESTWVSLADIEAIRVNRSVVQLLLCSGRDLYLECDSPEAALDWATRTAEAIRWVKEADSQHEPARAILRQL